jgi:hypothetical protein
VTTEVYGKWVTTVIGVVVAQCPDDANVQLSILTRALARAGKILGVDREILCENLERAYNTENIEEVKQ